MRRHRAAVLALASLALVASAGCSDDKDPTVLPTLTATPTPTTTAVVLPPSATPYTSQALDAFVRFYFQQLNLAFNRGDGALIRALSDPACEACNNYATSLDNDSNRIQGVSFSSLQVAAPPVQPTGTIVEVSGLIPARRAVDANGAVIRELPSGGRFHFQVNVVRISDSWLVRGIRKVGG